MNANSLPPVQAINDWLRSASAQLMSAGIASARLDAEIILAHTLRKSRTYLHAHSENTLEPRELEIADTRLALRLDHVPIAYIVGHKEFYGRSFIVTTATLIPRPESESIIDMLNDIVPKNRTLFDEQKWKLVDVGTGSGCLGITAKLELPELDVSLLDISQYALEVASKNARQLHADVSIIKSDLLKEYPLDAHIIIANLPYVDRTWERSPDTAFEPALALFAENKGLALIFKLIDQSTQSILPRGFLLLEADSRQHQTIIAYAQEKDFRLVAQSDYCMTLQRS